MTAQTFFGGGGSEALSTACAIHLESKIAQYLGLVEKTTGQRPKLNSAVAPFFPESPLHDRAFVPFTPGEAVICQSCRRMLAIDNQLTPHNAMP